VCWPRPGSTSVIPSQPMAVAVADLDEIASGLGNFNRLEAFRDAMAQSIPPRLYGVESDAFRAHTSEAGQSRWQWLTRDQECRFDYVLELAFDLSDSDSARALYERKPKNLMR